MSDALRSPITAMDCIYCEADSYQREDGKWECDFGHVFEGPFVSPALDVERLARAFVAVGMEIDGMSAAEARQMVEQLAAEYEKLA
jgi:hypothetical protein